MAIELKNRIEADLGVTVPMVRFLEGPSVRELADFIASQLGPLLNAIRTMTPQTIDVAPANCIAPEAGLDSHAAGHLLANLETLSNEQVDSLLLELYAEKGDS